MYEYKNAIEIYKVRIHITNSLSQRPPRDHAFVFKHEVSVELSVKVSVKGIDRLNQIVMN